MTRNQEAYLSMSKKVVGEMQRHHSTWTENAVIVATIANVEKVMSNIALASARQNRKTEGLTKHKREYRKKLNTQSDVILGVIRSYAITINNKNLYENANLSISEIRKIKDSEILIKVGTITKIVTNNMAELVPYGMNDKIMLDYSEARDGYKEYLTKPQEIIAERKTATSTLVKLFSDLEIEFNEFLDNHMMQYKLSEPQFYTDYINARVIYDASRISKSLIGTVTDQETGEPLPYVEVSARLVSKKIADKYVKSTSHIGNFQFKSLPEGVYKVSFKLPFYTTQVADCVIHPNALTRLNWQLKKKTE